MKLQRILISIIIIIATLLIGAGVLYSLPKEEPKKVYKEDRNYKTVVIQPEQTIANPQLTKKDFGKTANEIGFEKVECHQTLCVATHDTYKDNNYRDRVQLEQDPEGNNLFTITLYFYKKDYTLENIHTHLNNIVPNYAGTKVTEEQLKELQEIYEKGKIEQASKTYAVGPYTMELLLKKHNEDFYQVRFRYVSTSLYN